MLCGRGVYLRGVIGPLQESVTSLPFGGRQPPGTTIPKGGLGLSRKSLPVRESGCGRLHADHRCHLASAGGRYDGQGTSYWLVA